MSTSETTITTEQLAQRLKRGGPFQFWNVLFDPYFTGEFIVGSQWLPSDQLGREVASLGLSKDAEIVVYCSDSACPISGTAADKLRTLGYTNVRTYEGGLAAWKAAGGQLFTLTELAAA